jgi:hypothetical protein
VKYGFDLNFSIALFMFATCSSWGTNLDLVISVGFGVSYSCSFLKNKPIFGSGSGFKTFVSPTSSSFFFY